MAKKTMAKVEKLFMLRPRKIYAKNVGMKFSLAGYTFEILSILSSTLLGRFLKPHFIIALIANTIKIYTTYEYTLLISGSFSTNPGEIDKFFNIPPIVTV